MVAKPNLHKKAEDPNREPGERSVPIFDKLFYVLFLFLPFVTLIQTVLARPGEHTVTPQVQTFHFWPAMGIYSTVRGEKQSKH